MGKLSKKQGKKVAKGEATPIMQYCIKSHFFDEVMKLPEAVKIVELVFETGFAMKRMSEPITTKLADHGVTAMRKTDPSMEVEGKLTGTRNKMKTDIKAICDETGLNPKTVRVRRLVIDVKENQGHFARMTKMVPAGEDGKPRRLTVLGLLRWDGDENAIAKACSAKKFNCKYDTQIVRTVICEEG